MISRFSIINISVGMVLFFCSYHINIGFDMSGGMYSAENLNMILHTNKKKPKTDEEAVEQFQATFIREMFLKQMMNDDALMTLTSDDDDDEDMMGLKEEMTFHNYVLMDKIAEKLAKQDAFKLKKQLMKNYQYTNGQR